MPSVCFTIDGGEPCGTLDEMGCEEFASAQEILDALKSEANGRGIEYALSNWSLLDGMSVTVTYTPDIPEELQVEERGSGHEGFLKHRDQLAKLMAWIRENETTATWNDWSHSDEPS